MIVLPMVERGDVFSSVLGTAVVPVRMSKQLRRRVEDQQT